MARFPNPRWTPALALIVGLLSTAAVTYGFHRSAQERDLARFENAIEAARDRIEVRLDTYLAMLVGARALFSAAPAVTWQSFHDYVRQLEVQRRYPGIQGIGFSLRFGAADRERIERAIAAQGQRGFHVWPQMPRQEYHSIVFLEPLDRRNQAAIGYDMATEPVRREAMIRARDTGLPAASGKVTLVQEIDEHKQAGFLLYVPVYEGGATPATVEERRRALKGFVYSPFRMDDLLSGIFGAEQHPRVSFAVYDSAEVTPGTLLHDSGATAPPDPPRFAQLRTLTVAGRLWTIAFRSQRALDEGSPRRAVPYIFALGALLSGALFAVTRAQTRAREKAEASDRETQAERAHLRRLFAQAPALITIFRGPQQTLEFLNDPARRLLGERPVGKPLREAIPELDPRQLEIVERVYRTGERYVGSEAPLALDWGGGQGPRERFFNFVHEPMRGAAGTVEGVMSFAFEVTDQVLARRSVEASERRFRMLTSHAPVGIFLCDAEGSCLFANESLASLLGRSAQQIAGDHWTDMVHPDDRRLVVGRWREAAGRDQPFDLDYRVRTSTGQTRWVNGSVIALPGADGRVGEIIGTVTDVTERHLAAESLQMQARVLENMSEGVSLSDEEGFILYTNAAEDHMFGYGPGELIGKHVTVQNRYPAEQNERIVRTIIAELRANGVWQGEFENVRKDGSTFTTSARITALRAAGKQCWVCVQEDVTDRKRVQQERERLLVDLEQAVRARDDFLSIAGHELRTPLAALKLLVQSLQRHVRGPAGGAFGRRGEEMLQKTARQVDRLERLVGELLDVSRIAAGHLALHLEETDLAALVRDVADRFAEQLQNARCEVTLHVCGEVSGRWDRSRIDQVVSNLVSNAIKYGAGKPIEISVGASHGQAFVSVQDHGIGIPEAARDRIFGRFERAVSDRHYGGLGLGLWISRQIVESHGGTIRFETVPGAGTTFAVQLPIPARSASDEERTSSEGARITSG